MKTKTKPCTCIDKLNELLKPYNTELIVGYSFGGIVGYSFGGTVKQVVSIATTKIDSKKRLGPKIVVPAYCPFCGKKIKYLK